MTMLHAKDLMPDHQTSATLHEHLRGFCRGDVDAVMADYSSRAVLFTPQGVLRGREAIREYFVALLDEFPPGSSLEVKQRVTDHDMAYVVWAGESDTLRIPFATDTLIIRQGTIMRQTFAAQIEAKTTA